MKTRKLGNSPLHLTPVGLGTWAIGGGDWKFGWGAQDDALSIRTIHEAMAVGINWIDTAEFPIATADGPGTQADGREMERRIAELTGLHGGSPISGKGREDVETG